MVGMEDRVAVVAQSLQSLVVLEIHLRLLPLQIQMPAKVVTVVMVATLLIMEAGEAVVQVVPGAMERQLMAAMVD